MAVADAAKVDESVAGITFPAIGFGTMRQRGDACAELVDAALAMGYRNIDTARKYGNEAAVGAGIRRSSVSRDDFLVTTKLPPDDLPADRVRAAVEDSLRNLGLDYVDLFLVHWPRADVPLADTLGVMADLREAGLTRFIGVSNFPSALLEEAVGITDLVTNQVEYHPYLAQDVVLPKVRDLGLVLTAYCPLGRGGPLLRDPVLGEIAATHGRSVAQVALRWLVQQPRVVAVPGTSSVEHLRENLSVYDFTLDDSEMAAIGRLARGDRVVNPPTAPAWD